MTPTKYYRTRTLRHETKNEFATIKCKLQDKEDNKEDDKYEKVCYMCRRPESKAGSMISMPGGMNLCHDCMQKAFDSVTKGGMDFSKFSNMPYMNMNLNDLNVTPPAVEIPKKQKIKKKSQEQPVILLIDELDKPDGSIDTFFLGPIQDGRIWLESRPPIDANIDNLIIMFTKNFNRPIDEALLRRCHPIRMTYLDSTLERRALKLLSGGGRPTPEVQKWFELRAIGRVRVDLWYPDSKLVVEIDGPHHKLPLQQAKDERRDAALAAIGIETLRVSDCDLDDRPAGVVEDVTRGLR